MKLDSTIRKTIPIGQYYLPFLVGIQLASVIIFSSWSLETSWIPQAIALPIILIFGFQTLFHRRLTLYKPIEMYSLWIIWAILTLVIAGAFSMITSDSIITLVKLLLITFIYSNIVESRRDLVVIALVVFLGYWIAIALSWDELDTIRDHIQTPEYTQRLYGVAGNPNLLALYTIVMITLVLVLLGTPIKTALKFLLFPFLPALLYILNMVGSRKGFLALPLTILVWFYFLHFARFKSITIQGKISLLILSLFMVVSGWVTIRTSPHFKRFAVLLDFSAKEHSRDERMELFHAGVDMFIHKPVFGVGYDRYRVEVYKYGLPHDVYSHSTVIETLTCTGIIGFALYYCSHLLLLRHAVKLRRQLLNSYDWYALSWIIIMLINILFFSIFCVMTDNRFFWPLTGCMVGYTYKVIVYRG